MKIIYESEEKYIYDMRGMYFFMKIHTIQLIISFNGSVAKFEKSIKRLIHETQCLGNC